MWIFIWSKSIDTVFACSILNNMYFLLHKAKAKINLLLSLRIVNIFLNVGLMTWYFDAAVSYPPAPYVSAQPPMGYPSKDDPTAVGYPQQRVPEETTSRGDGFWKGW